MQVGNRLLAVEPNVGHEAVSFFGHAELLGDLPGGLVDLAEDGRVLRRQGVGRRDVPFRDDQHMHRGLRADVVEGEHVIVLEYGVRGEFASHDLAEDAVAHRTHSCRLTRTKADAVLQDVPALHHCTNFAPFAPHPDNGTWRARPRGQTLPRWAAGLGEKQMAVVAYFNGQFVDPDGAWVPLEERGHQFGDGVYEVIRVYSGRPFLMEEHLERLERSLRVIDIANPHTSEEWAHLIAESVRRSGEAEAQIYLQVTRGSAVRGHVFPGEAAPNVSLVVRPAAAPVYPEDAALLALPDERWPNVYVKSINLLPNVIAKEAAKRAGAVEAMLVRAGVITEGASSNLWFVIGGRVYTHPANRYILGGITRQFVLQLARETGVEVVEEAVPFSKLGEVQEVFVTSTTQEILPVARVFTDRRIASALEALPAEPAETLLPQVQDPVELWRRPGDAVVTERLAEAFAQALEKFRNYEPLLQA